jgi:CHAT domain-containing protein
VFSNAAPSGAVSTRGLSLRRSANTRSTSSATLEDLPPLPDTAEELREMALALKVDGESAVRLGRAASETAVKQADLSTYRVIAFATHGLKPGDLNGLTQPALALSNPTGTGEADADGLLTMEEILGLRMNADWVVLSACNTASGDGHSAEAVSGLGRAFFYAGSRALLATNWPVETVSARLLTTELFRLQAVQPDLGRAQALRAAMLATMERKASDVPGGKARFSYAHPLFWAPYSLIGDGGK